MASGDTKTESYLRVAAEGTRADLPSDNCCNTKTQNLILGVANRIMDVEDEVEELKNNPDVVDIVATYADLQNYDTSGLTNNDIIRVLQDETHGGVSTYYRFTKNPDTWTFIGESEQYSDFVGTDGTADGTHGLVPAPATTDAGKFLKADGTWDTAGGGGITELSSADYDYPENNPVAIAIWNVEPGFYRIAPHVNIQSNTTDNAWEYSSPLTVIVNNEGANTWTEAVAYGYNTILGANIGRFIITGPNGVKDKNEIAQAPSIVTTPGNSDSQVMTQNATTSMVFADPLYRYQISIGSGAITSGARAIAIGQGASASGERAISIGAGAECIRKGGVSFGGGVTYNGQMNIAATSSSYGYNNTAYRLLSGLYDGQNAHDAVTVGQVNSVIDNLNSALNTNIPHIGA